MEENGLWRQRAWLDPVECPWGRHLGQKGLLAGAVREGCLEEGAMKNVYVFAWLQGGCWASSWTKSTMKVSNCSIFLFKLKKIFVAPQGMWALRSLIRD